jgi:pyruvate dehydrogenase E2 component (dihydrolipoamide acetyltransferase)
MAETISMPKLGFDMAEGTLVRWVILEGEPVTKGAVLAEIETDKATVEVESTYDGIVARHLVKAGDIVPVNTPIAVIAAPGEKVEIEAAAPESTAPEPAQAAPQPATPVEAASPVSATAAPESGRLPGGVKASPLARRLAEEQGIDLLLVSGTGPGGRIVRKDIEAYISSAAAALVPSAVPQAAPVGVGVPPLPVSSLGQPPADQVVPLNRLRSIIGRRMVEAKQQVPHFYVTHEFDMAKVMELRKQVNNLLPDQEKVSVNDFVVKASALALRQFPNLNASLKNDTVVRHGQVNVGVAVAVEGGLMTVVCKDTDRKSLRQIATELRATVGRARAGKVRPEDIEGSTFSVSNLGMYDVESFIAIINPPEAAILAVGSAREVAVVKDGAVVPGLRMKATISVDHRVSDGVEAAQFLQALANYLEEPLRLLV